MKTDIYKWYLIGYCMGSVVSSFYSKTSIEDTVDNLLKDNN